MVSRKYEQIIERLKDPAYLAHTYETIIPNFLQQAADQFLRRTLRRLKGCPLQLEFQHQRVWPIIGDTSPFLCLDHYEKPSWSDIANPCKVACEDVSSGLLFSVSTSLSMFMSRLDTRNHSRCRYFIFLEVMKGSG